VVALPIYFGNLTGSLLNWADGKLYHPDCVTRSFQRVLKNNNIPKMRFHDLRHSTASIYTYKQPKKGKFGERFGKNFCDIIINYNYNFRKILEITT